MFLHTEKTMGLAHLSYVVGDGGSACVIDPQLDCQRYIDIANQHGCRIVHILETHRNEDFVSGARALSELTGAQVWHGPNADTEISYAGTARDGDRFEIGNLAIGVIETPGHTFDSVCYTLTDTEFSNEPIGVFTGDTLFVGDVGRTDFYPDQERRVARSLYRSIQKLLALGDHVQIYPAHGAGSVCGGGMADREFSTIGYERRHNPMASLTTESDFVERKLEESHYVAPYFSLMEQANAEGRAVTLSMLQCQPLPADALAEWYDPQTRPGWILDVRDLDAIKTRYLRNSLCLHGPLISAYAGWFLVSRPPLLLVAADHRQAREAHLQLLRLGLDTVRGYTTSVPLTVTRDDDRCDSIDTVTADTVKQWKGGKDDWTLLDVRKHDEVESSPMEGATHIYLGHLAERYETLPRDRHYTVMCGSGRRATVGASHLKARGFSRVDVFSGSMQAWKALNER